jgi:hypothetical protein
MSIFFIGSIASIARSALLRSGSVTSSLRIRDDLPRQAPNLSLSQPHCWAAGSSPAESSRGERLALELEFHRHDRAGRTVVDLLIVLRRLFGLAVEPKTGGSGALD